jgi:protein-tyrosine phosphatase
MIDIHNHILPGIDDGADDLDEALAMARMAVADGIHTIVATPHCDTRAVHEFLAERDQAMAILREALDTNHIPLRLLPGAECDLDGDLLAIVHDHPQLLLGDNREALLVELPAAMPLRALADLLFEATSAGLQIVWAHPERHPQVPRISTVLTDLVNAGLHLQISTDSLQLRNGWTTWRTARKLLGRRLASILASDAHDTTRYPPCLARAAQRAASLTRQDPSLLVQTNPAQLLGLNVIPDLG